MTHRLCQTEPPPARMLMQQVKDSTMGGKMIETNYFQKERMGKREAIYTCCHNNRVPIGYTIR